jgi:hypothetical protein
VDQQKRPNLPSSRTGGVVVDQLDADREQFLTLIRRWHAAQPRPDQVRHCENVMRWLEQALDLDAVPRPARRDMVLAALGHDLFEDTAIPPADIVANFGAQVDRLIRTLTEGPDGVPAYVEQVASGPEEGRLIKLCDGIDNYSGLVENRLVLGDTAKWVQVVRRPMEPMFSRLAAIPFRQYPKAGPWLSQALAERRERFWALVEDLLR